MKNYILICLFCVFLIACTHVDNIVGNPPTQVRKFLNEIIREPERLYNLKKHFPEYIHSKYYLSSILDSHLVVGAVGAIKSEFSNIKYTDMFSWDSKSEVPMIFSDYNQDLILSSFRKEDIFKSCLLIMKKKADITIVWVKIDGQYYIYDIRGGVGAGYL